MTEDDLYALIDPVMKAAGAVPEVGETYAAPPLDVLRYYRRPVRLSPIPWFGRALSLVAVVRQPLDVAARTAADYRRFLTRVAMAINARFPPWTPPRAPTVVLAAVIVTPEPIGPEDDATLGAALGRLPRQRAVPFGLIRVNLGQEALAMALTDDPDALFPEASALAEALAPRFRRFVPLIRD